MPGYAMYPPELGIRVGYKGKGRVAKANYTEPRSVQSRPISVIWSAGLLALVQRVWCMGRNLLWTMAADRIDFTGGWREPFCNSIAIAPSRKRRSLGSLWVYAAHIYLSSMDIISSSFPKQRLHCLYIHLVNLRGKGFKYPINFAELISCTARTVLWLTCFVVAVQHGCGQQVDDFIT